MRLVVVVVAAALVLSACTETETPPVEQTPTVEETPPVELTATDVSALTVTGQREQVKWPWASLSPDGRTLMYYRGNGACVGSVDGSGEQCFEVDSGPQSFLSPNTAAWSPDGREVAITEEYGAGLEPDIWLLDVRSGKLTNLTDDGVVSEGVSRGGEYDFPDDARVDRYPSWSADGRTIRFIRKDGKKTALMTVPAGGGSATKTGTLDTDWDELRTFVWARDSVAWMSGPPDGGGGEVLVANATGGQKRKVLDGAYSLLSFSADGAFLLADKYGAEGAAGGGAIGVARVVPVGGGKPVAVATDDVIYPTWAPKGHAVAYLDGTSAIKVVGKPGAEPRVLFRGEALAAAGLDRLDWAPGAMLVRIGADTPVVLSLDG